jgi:NADPH:quinone reductase-like Zn-dependent oxidoreductase
MFAVYANSANATDPLSALVVGERPEPEARGGWQRIEVKAASLNHHDIWSLRGVGLPSDRLPMILGCDASGIDEGGREVVVHGIIGDPEWTGPETQDPKRSLLSEKYQGTFAKYVLVPERNLIAKPAALSFSQAAALPTSWLTAYSALVSKSGLKPGDTVLIQGAGGGVSTALTVLAHAMGFRTWVTTRDLAKRERSLALGADEVFESGVRLPARVDAVMETVGQATWAHSVRALRPGGTIVISGATSGDSPPAELTRIYFLELKVIGSTMGSKAELESLLHFMVEHHLEPVIDRVLPMSQARDGFSRMIDGNVFGKIVFTL